MESAGPAPLDDLRLAVNLLLHSMLDHPERLTLSLEPNKAGTLFRIYTPDDSDRAKLIGKQGRTARSLRTILLAARRKYGQHFTVDIS